MSVPTINPGTDILSEQYNKLVRLFTGASGAGSDTPVSFSRYTGASDYAFTVRHRVTDDDDFKGLIVQDKDGDTVLEVAALGGGGGDKDLPGVFIDTNRAKLVASNTRNWQSVGDVFLNRVRHNAGETTSFVPIQMAYQVSSQPPGGFGSTPGPTNLLPDDVTCHFYAQATNIAGGAAQNADLSLRAYEAICIQFANTGKRSMAAATMGMHTAVNTISFLDNPAAYDDFFGSCGIIMLTQDSSARPGFGTNVAPNCAFWVGGAPTWKFGYAYTDGTNQRLFTVDSGGTIRHRGNHVFEPGVTGHRIVADLSSATDVSRFMFESNVANGNSDVGVKPVGTATRSAWTAWGSNDLANAEAIRMFVNGSAGLAVIETFKTGAATARSLALHPGGVEKLRIQVDGNVCFPDVGLATTATAGFLYIPSCAGVPTGVPTVFAGTVPLVFDRTNDKLSVYRGGWKQTAALV